MTAAPAIARHRQQFPSLQHNTYFNYGGQGPMPQNAVAAIRAAYDTIQQDGPFGATVNAWLQERAAELRQAIAAEVGARASEIALTENVTSGCNIALWGLDWRAGDRVLLTDCEHPGVVAAVQEIARRFEVEVDCCGVLDTLNGGDPVAAIAEGITPKTRMVVLSHLLWNTGQVLPLADIVAVCRARSVRLLVDAAQSVGSLPLQLDDLGVDFYAFTGHKWLCGPAGVGGLYVRAGLLDELAPTFSGWRGITMDAAGNPTGWKADARRYEIATSAYPQYAGLTAAIAYHNQWGTPADRSGRICELSRYLWQQLNRLSGLRCLKTDPPEAGLVSFVLTTGADHKAFVKSLEDERIFVRTLAHPDCVRACVHYFTEPAELDRLVAAIARRL